MSLLHSLKIRLVVACALFLCGAFLVTENRSAIAQQFLWVYPFQGVQPAPTIDFSNPPISIGIQSGGTNTAAQNSNSRGPYTPRTIDIGSVAYASLGTSTTYVSADFYVSSIFVPFNELSTNCNFLANATVGTNAVICYLFNNSGGLVANTALAGTATSGANTFQTIAWTTPVSIQGPGRYFIAIQANGATDGLRTVASSTFVGLINNLQTGTFGVAPTLTIPTTFTTAQSPIAYLN